MYDICLYNAQLVTPENVLPNASLGIAGEKIAHIDTANVKLAARRAIDLEGKIVFPGLFDPHTHFGAGGTELSPERFAEDFRTETRDAIVGGVTTVATTTLLGIDLIAKHEEARHCAAGLSWVDYKLTSVVLKEEQLGQLEPLTRRGVRDYKFFTGYIGDQAEMFGMNPDGVSPALFYQACQALESRRTSAFAKIHAEDPFVRGLLVDKMRQMGGDETLVAWAETSPEWAESLQIYTYALIANDRSTPIYPVHISSAHSVDTIVELRRRGVNLIGETVAMFLNTTAHELDAKGCSKHGKIQPPVRFEADRQRLWHGIREGAISIVGTDSVPHTAASGFKEGGFWHCKVGVNNQMLDTLPLMYHEGINNGQIDLLTLARVTSTNAAKLYGLYPRKGAIAVGSDADLVVLDPERELRLGVQRSRGASDYSLWQDHVVRGAPVMTFLRGRLVCEEGEIIMEEPFGEYLSV